MNLKLLLLISLLIIPALLIGFLHLFGQNHFKVRNQKLAGVKLDQILSGRKEEISGKTVVVGLLPSPLSRADGLYLQRVLGRMDHLPRHGAFVCALESQAMDLNTYERTIQKLPDFVIRQPNQASVAASLPTTLGLKGIDTLRKGFFFALADPEGNLRNLYDLRQENLLDTLVMETVIVMEE